MFIYHFSFSVKHSDHASSAKSIHILVRDPQTRHLHLKTKIARKYTHSTIDIRNKLLGCCKHIFYSRANYPSGWGYFQLLCSCDGSSGSFCPQQLCEPLQKLSTAVAVLCAASANFSKYTARRKKLHVVVSMHCGNNNNKKRKRSFLFLNLSRSRKRKAQLSEPFKCYKMEYVLNAWGASLQQS